MWCRVAYGLHRGRHGHATGNLEEVEELEEGHGGQNDRGLDGDGRWPQAALSAALRIFLIASVDGQSSLSKHLK